MIQDPAAQEICRRCGAWLPGAAGLLPVRLVHQGAPGPALPAPLADRQGGLVAVHRRQLLLRRVRDRGADRGVAVSLLVPRMWLASRADGQARADGAVPHRASGSSRPQASRLASSLGNSHERSSSR